MLDPPICYPSIFTPKCNPFKLSDNAVRVLPIITITVHSQCFLYNSQDSRMDEPRMKQHKTLSDWSDGRVSSTARLTSVYDVASGIASADTYIRVQPQQCDLE